jgi:molecular chaperone DnaK (HSP70)
MRPSLAFDGTTTNREMFKGWQLPPRRPALGIQMHGDVAFVLIPGNAPVPAIGRQVFTTVHHNQTEISLLVLEGDFTQASRCNVLGHLQMVGLPAGPAGSAKIEVTYYVDEKGVLSVTAMDLNTQRQEQWLQEGYMAAYLT